MLVTESLPPQPGRLTEFFRRPEQDFASKQKTSGRRKNPAIGLRGETILSQPRTWKQRHYIRLWTYPDPGLKVTQNILQPLYVTASYLPIHCVTRFNLIKNILLIFYRRRIRGKFLPFLLKLNIAHHLVKEFFAVTGYPRIWQSWFYW